MGRPRKNFKHGIREAKDRGGYEVWLKLGGLRRPVHLRAHSGEELEEKVERRLHRHRPPQSSSISGTVRTLGEFLEQWIEIKKADPELAFKTWYADYQYKGRRWIELIGRLRLDKGQVTAHTIGLAKAHLLTKGRLTGPHAGTGLGTATVRGFMRTLRVALNDAEDAGLLVNPLNSNVKLRTVKRSIAEEKTAMTEDEVRDLVVKLTALPDGAESLDEESARVARLARWLVAFSLGPRQGEALGIRWSRLDLNTGMVRVDQQVQRQLWQHGCEAPEACGLTLRPMARPSKCPQRHGGGLVLIEPKGNKSRAVTLPPTLLHILRRHRALQLEQRLKAANEWHDLDLIFCNSVGRPIDPKADGQQWAAFLAEHGMERFGTHKARHTINTLLLDRGEDLLAVSQNAGHHSASFTQKHYFHNPGTPKRKIAATVDDILWGQASSEG